MNHLVIKLTKKVLIIMLLKKAKEKKSTSKTGVLPTICYGDKTRFWYPCGALSMEEQTKDAAFWGSVDPRRPAPILKVRPAWNIEKIVYSHLICILLYRSSGNFCAFRCWFSNVNIPNSSYAWRGFHCLTGNVKKTNAGLSVAQVHNNVHLA